MGINIIKVLNGLKIWSIWCFTIYWSCKSRWYWDGIILCTKLECSMSGCHM